jgi:glucosamine-6-phosphate deaminase
MALSSAQTHSGARIQVVPDSVSGGEAAAEIVREVMTKSVAERGKAVLGLATGATQPPVYARLAEMRRAGELSFAQVSTYNLDEFYPISPLDQNSYRYYMHRHLFSHVDLPANQAHVLDGTAPEHSVASHAAEFDRWIEEDGGLDLQLLGIGRNGHIGFNEPSSMPVDAALRLPTRVVGLHPVTIADSAKDFHGDADRVPRRALTVGVKPILAARAIVVLAFGPHKAEAVALSINGPMTSEVPGSLLQAAGPRVTWIIDPAAAARL